MTLLDEDHRDGTGSRPVVLLVEDEVLIRLASADWLEDAGFDVILAANGAEALAFINAGRTVDLVATDITMPGQPDGAGLVLAVRQLLPQVPVVVLSSIVPQQIATVVDRFVRKPFGSADLVAAVSQLIASAPRSRTSAAEAS